MVIVAAGAGALAWPNWVPLRLADWPLLLGTVLGVFAGAIPVAVALSLQRGFPVVLPWLQLGVLLVLVPLVGAAAAWVLTRGKLPMTRRQTLA